MAASGMESSHSICMLYPSGKCNGTCNRMHTHKTFHWQIEASNGCWADVEHDSAIEAAYCDPRLDQVELQVTIASVMCFIKPLA